MSKPNDFPPQDQTFVSHLVELRDRLLRAVLVVLVVFLGLFAFANDLYTMLAEPLMRHMPEGTSMIATEVASPFLTPFKLTLVLSVFAAMPFILYQLWAFVAPGLYQNERKLVVPLLVSSTLLFYLGMAFAYFVVFPLVFGFLTNVAPQGVAVMTDISRYLDFVLKMFFAFGIAFEVPIATILVIWTGLTTAESLASKRPYIIVVAFVVGMLLTPPDVISQTLLALPMWALFELGLVLSRWYVKKPDEETDTGTASSNTPDGATVATAAAAATAATAPSTDASSNTDSQSGFTAYGEEVEDHQQQDVLSEEELDAELDRIEAEETDDDVWDEEEWDEEDTEPHKEFEPISDELAKELDTEKKDAEDDDISENQSADIDLPTKE